MTSGFSMGSLAGLGVRGGPGPCPAALQGTRKPGDPSLGVLVVIDSKERSSAAARLLQGKMGGNAASSY